MTVDFQKELLHLFNQLVSKFAEDIIINGAFSLMLNVADKHPLSSNRLTIDIDFFLKRNFVDFIEELNNSEMFSIAGEPYLFTKIRTPKRKSAGRIEATACDIQILLDVQIDLYANPKVVVVDGKHVNITSPASIVIDKLDAISKPKVMGRPKDLYDLYILSLLFGFEYNEVAKHTDFKVSGDFEVFIESWKELEESYILDENLIGENRPNFKDLYRRVKEFASPFIASDSLITKEISWNVSRGTWVKQNEEGVTYGKLHNKKCRCN
jgi:hypothetical protein